MCPILDKTAGMCVFLLGTRTTSWLISVNTSCTQASNSGALFGSAWTGVFMKNSHLFQCGPQETWHKHFPWQTGSVYDVDNEGIPHCPLSLLTVISAHHRPVPSSKLHDRYELSLGGDLCSIWRSVICVYFRSVIEDLDWTRWTESLPGMISSFVSSVKLLNFGTWI